jgi:hypothetical protein
MYEVEAIGSTDAADIAKRRARDEGLKVRTVASIRAVDMPSKTERTRWIVMLAIADRGRG